MSLCRWGTEGSQVYVIETIVHPERFPADAVLYQCVCCGLLDEAGDEIFDANEMKAHLQKHRDAGQCVPDSVFVEIEQRGEVALAGGTHPI